MSLLFQIQTDIKEIVSTVRQMIDQAPNIIPPFDPENLGNITMEIMQSIDWSNPETYLQMTGTYVNPSSNYCCYVMV